MEAKYQQDNLGYETSNVGDGLALIKIIDDAIESDNIVSLHSSLDLLPLEEADTPLFIELLSRWINRSVESNNAEAVREIIMRFEGSETGIDMGRCGYRLPVISRLYLINKIPLESLAFVKLVFPERGFEDYMVDFINYDSTPDLIEACRRLIAVYGEQPPNIYTLLYGLISDQEEDEEYPNVVMKEFLTEKVKETANIAPKPEWVKDYGLGGDYIESSTSTPAFSRTGNISSGSNTSPSSGSIEMTTTFSPPSLGAVFSSSQAPIEFPSEEEEELIPMKVEIQEEEEALPYDDELVIPPLPPVVFQLPSTEEAVKLLSGQIPGVTRTPEEIELLREHLYAQYSISTTTEKIELLRPVYTSKAVADLQTDETIFRILGPANPQYNIDLTRNNPCCKYGGCRMFTCVEFENYDDDFGIIDEYIEDNLGDTPDTGIIIGSTIVDWFRGNCDFCKRKIAKRHYAIREPMFHGGWRGCYCSLECLREALYQPSTGTLMMIGRVWSQLQQIGIQDRDYREPLSDVEVDDMQRKMEQLDIFENDSYQFSPGAEYTSPTSKKYESLSIPFQGEFFDLHG